MTTEINKMVNDGIISRLRNHVQQFMVKSFGNTLPDSYYEFLEVEKSMSKDETMNENRDYLMSTIACTIGLSNVWRFPIKVYQNGGIVFLILYLLVTYSLGICMTLLEMGLGQFTSMGCTDVFECVPILIGIGWSQIAILSFVMIVISINTSWAYIYLIDSFRSILPWVSCNNTFNSPHCVSSYNLSEATNKSITSSEEYFYRFVLLSKFNNSNNKLVSLPSHWQSNICLMIVWVTSCLVVIGGVKVRSKIVYFTFSFSCLALFLLIFLGCSLPGSSNGLINLLKPNITKLMLPTVYLAVFEHYLYSSGVGLGVYICLSSYNSFHHNVYRDVFIIGSVDLLIAFLGSLAFFSLLGHMAIKTENTIDKILERGTFFTIYTQALSIINGYKFWTIIFFMMTITLSMDVQFMFVETVVTAFKLETYSFLMRILYTVAICLFCFIFGTFIIYSQNFFVFFILDSLIFFYATPIIMMLECIAIGIIYGTQDFSRDIKMMTGSTLNTFYSFSIAFICPLTMVLLLVTKLFGSTEISLGKEQLFLNDAIYLYLVLFALLSPILFCIIFKIKQHCSQYGHESIENHLSILMDSPIYYGPKFKLNWLKDKYYCDKFLKNYKNPIFIKKSNENDDLKLIYKTIRKGMQSPEMSSSPSYHANKNKLLIKKKKSDL